MKTKEEIHAIITAQQESQERKIQEYWENLPPFNGEVNKVPHIPIPITPFHIQQLIKAGAIPKKDLKDGALYKGKCRNAMYAVWHQKENFFEYERHKFGDVFPEDINHFEDDNGYDLFVPIKQLTEGINKTGIEKY